MKKVLAFVAAALLALAHLARVARPRHDGRRRMRVREPPAARMRLDRGTVHGERLGREAARTKRALETGLHVEP